MTSKENISSEKQEISNSVYLAISLLNEFDKSKLVKKFIWDLADRENLNTATKSVRIANELGRKDFAVQAGKILYYNHVLLDPLSFPEVERPKFGKIKVRSDENLKLYPSISKAKKILNWRPTISLREGILKTVKFYKKDF